nr:MAG TPA: hypothetical protein [Bacteriophage sp.]
MRRLVKHLTPDEKYAFIERVVDGLPGAVIESDILTYNMSGDQGLFVDVTYTPKGGKGDIHGRNDLESMPRDLYHPNSPGKVIGYKLLSYYLAVREANNKLGDIIEEIKESGEKVKKANKRARSIFRRLCRFIHLCLLDIVITEKEQYAINSYLGIEHHEGQFIADAGEEDGNLLSALMSGTTLASELAEAMVGEHGDLAKIAMFKETGIPFIVSRDIVVEMDLENVDDEYQSKMNKFIQHYREYLSMHGDNDVDDKIKRVVCGLRLVYSVVKTLRYPSPDKSEVVRRYRGELTNWSVLAKRLYNVIDQF